MNTTSMGSARSPRRSPGVRAAVLGIATAAALALCAPAISAPTASAEPLVEQNSMTLPPIPFDAELAAAVRMLRDAGVDRMALDAAQAIMSSVGQLSTEQAAARVTPVPAAGTDPIGLLRALGVQTLTPSVSPFCAAPTADNPLGLVSAGAGAVAGPWPLASEPLAPLQQLFGITLPKLNLVDKGQTAFAFVPATPTHTATPGSDTGKMQVAWFNTTTMKGGFADLKPVADAPILKAVPLLSGVRLAPVDTESGTVLAAVFGNSDVAGRNCFFLPAVGVVDA
ncbi:hypothetical protein AAFP35_19290 [Gordonia sp. CPCC 206044]|uniref:hypothetical protein n=1 Tax=Gordonia sp. CPCC 206044 TaxID=3140793 RepID=UPI003AF40AB2